MPAHIKRNYGPAHQAQRRAWTPVVAMGTIHCWRCGQLIKPGQEWDLGHRDGLPSHPEHANRSATCIGNRSAGAVYGNRKREPRTNIW